MRILIVRHGDPDYERDSLTAKGDKEAALLAERLAGETIKDFYVSPLGRAVRTASYTLNKMGREAKTLDWLREFPAVVDLNQEDQEKADWLKKAYPDTQINKENGQYAGRIAWDMMPVSRAEHPEYQDSEGWRVSLVSECSDMEAVYDRVCKGLDELLASYGYERDGKLYRTKQGNEDTIVLFCHFGLTCVLLSHFWNVSPFMLWHSLCTAPTSVTELFTEEREKGIVTFRATKIGDISHLYAAGEQPAFSARFCEYYEAPDRH